MTALRQTILAALAVHAKVTIKTSQPKRLWRFLKRELQMCEVTFDDQAVHVTWKAVP